MTVYRFTGPRTQVQGSIDEVLTALSHEIEPSEHYRLDGHYDLTGLALVERLIALQGDAEPNHTYVERVSFHSSLDPNPREYVIERVELR